MIAPGKKNNICDVDEILIGNASDSQSLTGITVILPSKRVVAAVDIRGGAPGSRETELLNPINSVSKIDALVFSGGSAFGLEGASEVTKWLASQGKGFMVDGVNIPIVPSAIIFDFPITKHRNWEKDTPFKSLAIEACKSANNDTLLGNIGAGIGATAGSLKGGLGSASYVTSDKIKVGALSIVNPVGNVIIPGSDKFWAGSLEFGDEFGGLGSDVLSKNKIHYDHDSSSRLNTTICVVATNISLTKVQASRVAIMAQDGLARAIRPVHTPFDGDCVFVLSTAEVNFGEETEDKIIEVGTLAADCVSRSIARGVYNAKGIGKFKSYKEIYQKK